MKITYNWLKEYCDFRLSPGELAEALTSVGLVVAGMQPASNGDFILEIEITSNRPDCLGVIGIAREVAALTRSPLKLPPGKYTPGKRAIEAKVTVKEPDLCPRYTARVIRGVKIGPSPAWLQERLGALGLRPINNVVDITNYVLMEWGQPLHAFDLDKLEAGEIIVRRAMAGERIVTIDGAKLDLNPEVLVIADTSRPVALAGVMGGKDTEVHEGTCNILLESARFRPATVRRAAKRFGLKTESSYRFERGVDIEGVELASRRATALILQLAGGEAARDSVDVRLNVGASALGGHVPLRLHRLNAVLGTNLEEKTVRDILERLGFAMKGKKGFWEVVVPSFRGDVTQEIDLIEEVARIYGYNNIPTNTRLSIQVNPRGRKEQVEERVRGLLAGWGFFEAVTSSIVKADNAIRTGPFTVGEPLRIRNPIRAGEDSLRQTLFSNLLQAKRHNQDYGTPRVRLYELAKVYLPVKGQKLPMEKTCLGLIYEEDASTEQTGKEAFYTLKGIIEGLLSALGIKEGIHWEGLKNPSFAREKSCKVELGGKPLAILGEVAQELVKIYDLRSVPCLAEIDFDLLIEKADLTATFQKLPLYPPIDRDIAIVVDEAVTWAQIESCVKGAGTEFLERVEFFDLYRGKQIPPGKKSIAFRVHFRSPDRTLRAEEADRAQAVIISELSKKLGAVVR